MSYIEKESLIAELEEELAFDSPMYTYEQQKYFTMGLRCAYRDVNRQPIVDVVEVRHGYWITRNVRCLEIEVKCSVCGSRDFYPADYKNIRYPNYCGDCGAKMDGERKEE